MEYRLIVDGEGELPADKLFGGAPAAVRSGSVAIQYGCLLVRTGDAVVLVDAGIGPHEHPLGGRGGRLEAALAAAGVAPGDVTHVIITHSHLDHIGGLTADGRPRFAAARHVMSRVEWDWCAQRDSAVAEEQLPPLERAGVLELVDGTEEVVPGLRLVPAPGHTPGHLALAIGSDLLFVADAIVHPRHIEHPEWTMEFDEDPAQNVETRTALLARAAAEGRRLAASHLPDYSNAWNAAVVVPA